MREEKKSVNSNEFQENICPPIYFGASCHQLNTNVTRIIFPIMGRDGNEDSESLGTQESGQSTNHPIGLILFRSGCNGPTPFVGCSFLFSISFERTTINLLLHSSSEWLGHWGLPLLLGTPNGQGKSAGISSVI